MKRCTIQHIKRWILLLCILLIPVTSLEITAMNNVTDKVKVRTVSGKWLEFSASKEMSIFNFGKKQDIVEVILPDSVEQIGDEYFADCKNLQKVVLSSNMKEIPFDTFQGCENLREVIIPEGVTEISMSAFAGCKNLETITLPKGLKKVDDWAFGNCEKLNNVTIMDSFTKVHTNAFIGTAFMNAIWQQSEGEYVIWNHILFGTKTPQIDIVIPEGVTSIASYAFEGQDQLRSVVIPTSMKIVGDAVFVNSGLNAVSIYGGQEIGMAAFEGTDIKEINLPLSIKKIGDGAFLDCEQLTKIQLPSGLKEIGKYAFYATGIRHITFPESVVKIGQEALGECKNLKKVTILNRNVKVSGFDYDAYSEYIGDNTILGMSMERDSEHNPYYDKKSQRSLIVCGYLYSTTQELVERLKWVPRFYGCKSIRFQALDPKTKNKSLDSIKVPKTLIITEGKSKTIPIQLPKNLKRVTSFTKKKGQVKVLYNVLDGSCLKVNKKGCVKALSLKRKVPSGFATNRIYITVILPDGNKRVFTTKIIVKPKTRSCS